MIRPNNKYYQFNYHLIGIVNICIFILAMFMILCIQREIFVNMCYDNIILLYILIITNITVPINIYTLFVYLFCNPDTIYIKFIYCVIQTTELILILYQFIIFFTIRTCFDMDLYKNPETVYTMILNMYIYVLFLCGVYISYILCVGLYTIYNFFSNIE